MKKFLCFFGATILLMLMVAYMGYRYLIPKDYPVFIESFDHGVMTIESSDAFGKDNKFEIFCKRGENLTININPERTDDAYYNLDRLIVNGEDRTDEVNMLEYNLTVEGKTTVLAYFKKSKAGNQGEDGEDNSVLHAPEIYDYAKNEYLGSANAYDIEDPSVIYDEASEYYYCFASNNVVMKSKDLHNWEKRTNYFEVPDEAETQNIMRFSQFDSVSTWAKDHGYSSDESVSTDTNDRQPKTPEIIKIGGEYYLYFALSKEVGSNESAIFCVKTLDLETAINTNQWDEVGLIVASCGHNATTSDNAVHDAVNCVHPSVFESANGNKLYMAYGGYFGNDESGINGSINLLQLDPQTGLLKKGGSVNDAGAEICTLHGSKTYHAGITIANPGKIPALSKEDGSLVSACDIVYNSSEKCYYMFVTYGVSDTNYEIRVAKSKDPEGPYLDFAGNDMASFGKSLTDNQYSKGTPFISGYNFIMSSGGGVSYTDIGKASIGAPSIIKTSDGKWLMASQARAYYKIDGSIYCGDAIAAENDVEYQTRPALEIRQIFFKNDWPLPMAEVYDEETVGSGFTKTDMTGHWDAVIFDGSTPGKTYDAVGRYTSQKFSILNNLVITEKTMKRGSKLDKTTFKRVNDKTYEIVIDGNTFTVYPSLVWDNELDCETVAFTGFDSEGNVIMAKKDYNSYTGIYLEVFNYLVDKADPEVAEAYNKKLKKISDNPSQEKIDKYSTELIKKVLASYEQK